jgi:hypothetical protein
MGFERTSLVPGTRSICARVCSRIFSPQSGHSLESISRRDANILKSMRHYSIRPRDDGRSAERVLAIPVSRRHGWFDDEVAIDFPSLHAVVERMRASFVGASNEEHQRGQLLAELHLSAREAFNGVTVPLDVPVRRVCGACGGRGEVWPDPCAGCGGTGEAMASHAVRLVVPPRVQDGDRFALSLSAPSAPLTRVEVRVVLS